MANRTWILLSKDVTSTFTWGMAVEASPELMTTEDSCVQVAETVVVKGKPLVWENENVRTASVVYVGVVQLQVPAGHETVVEADPETVIVNPVWQAPP